MLVGFANHNLNYSIVYYTIRLTSCGEFQAFVGHFDHSEKISGYLGYHKQGKP